MSNLRQRISIQTRITAVSGICPALQDVIPAQSGYAYGLLQVVATNRQAGVRTIKFYDNSTQISPNFNIGGSGTLFWEYLGGGAGQLELGSGNPLRACLSTTGIVDVAVYYVSHDVRPSIYKYNARAATYIPPASDTATRTPNRFGGQGED